MAAAGLIPVCQHPFCARKPETGDNTPGVVGTIAARVHMATILLLRYSMLLALSVTKTHCCVLFSFLSAGTSRSFSATLLPLSSLCGYMELFYPSCKTLRLPSPEPMRSLSTHCFSLSRSPQNSIPALQHFDCSPEVSVVHKQWDRGQVMPRVPLSGLLIKMLHVLVQVSISEGYHKE